MSTVAISRLQDRLDGPWVRGATGFFVEGRPVGSARRVGAHPLPATRGRVRGPVKAGEAARHAEPPAAAVPVKALARPARLPVPALDPPDRAEARLILTIGVLAASALVQVLSASGDWLAGWDRFGDLVARLLN